MSRSETSIAGGSLTVRLPAIAGRSGVPSSITPATDAFTDLIFKSPRRQFLLLASLPVAWVLIAHLGPILQMFWVSFLDSYPPTVGQEPGFTIANWMKFFEERILHDAVLPHPDLRAGLHSLHVAS